MFIQRLSNERAPEHIDIFLKAPRAIYVGHIASATVLLYMATKNPEVPIWFIYLWGFLEIICYPVMLEAWSQLYQRTPPNKRNYQSWINYMDMICLIVGTSWGTMLFISLNPASPADFAIQMSITAGATAAAVRSLAAFPKSFILYAVPFLGLVVVRLLMLGDDFILLGGLVATFLFMLLASGRDVMESVKQFITIKNENLDLAERYRSAAVDADHANREKTRLLAAASHDLRQPIHAIGLHIETLPIETMDEKSRLTLQRIRNSLQTLSRLFNSLLDVSLLDSGKIKVRNSVFKIDDMLNAILDDYEPLAEIANVTLYLDCAPMAVEGDAVLLRRMVQNLLSNSIRYSKGGTVRIAVTTIDGKAQIAVSDEGPGIPKEHQSLIFEEFTQLQAQASQQLSNQNPALGGHIGAAANTNTNAHSEKGLGLGLAIVRRLADLQELTLGIESSSQGTCLQIGNIQLRDLKALGQAEKNPMQKIGAVFQHKTILIADDDHETLEATKDLLMKWGCNVWAISELEQLTPMAQKPDLVISDYSFETDYTGLDVIQVARELYDPAIPALIVSGDSSDILKKKIESEGLLLIHKPVQPVQLRSALLDVFLTPDQDAAE